MQIRFSTSLIGFQQSADSFPLLHFVSLYFAKFIFSEILCFANTPPFRPFKVATLKAFQLEPLPSLLSLILGGFHVMFPSQRSLTVFVQA